MYSYTANGWKGSGDPLETYKSACSSAGPNWVQQFVHIANHTRLINLAVNGATSNQDIVFSDRPDFRSQTTSFLTHIAPFPQKVTWTGDNAIFIITFGTNDINKSYQSTIDNGTTLHSKDLDSYFDTVERLYAAGARRFVFNNVVPFDRAQRGIKQGPMLQAKLKRSIIDFNTQLDAKAAAYCGSKADIICSVFDTHALFTRVMDNFQDFGFITPDTFCDSYARRHDCEVTSTVGPSCLGPSSVYVWKDDLHPMWTTHKLWAQGLINQLNLVDNYNKR